MSVDEGCAPYTPRIGTIQSSLAISGLSSIRHAQEVLAPDDVGRSGRGKRVELWQGGPGLPRTLMTQLSCGGVLMNQLVIVTP